MNEESTIIEKLDYLEGTKTSIKNAIISKGQEVTENDTFRSYAQKIAAIETGIDTSDATATAEDIKAGKTAYVDGEKIEGIHIDEDLTSVLNAQDEKIAELEAALENKTAGGGEPNIFVQETEPSKKDGIWIKSSDYTPEHIISVDEVFTEPSWNTTKMSSLKAIPYQHRLGSISVINTDVYLFGGSDSSSSTRNAYTAYKYDTLTDTYTQLTDIPISFNWGAAATVGTDIYLLVNKNTYKYDTLTDTYTQLTDIPYGFSRGNAISIGTNVYILGSHTSGTSGNRVLYKYDTLTDTYTQLTNIPYDFTDGASALIGTNIYLFGGGESSSSYRQYTYKYDTLTDTYTMLTDIPYKFYAGSAVAVGTDIFLFGDGLYAAKQYAYKYDTLTDTYTQLSNIPYGFYQGSSALVGNEIYLFGGNDYPTKVQVMTLPSADFEDNSVVISQDANTYTTKLLSNDSNIRTRFGDAWFYTTEDGLITTLSTYYGDGTNWIKFKN